MIRWLEMRAVLSSRASYTRPFAAQRLSSTVAVRRVCVAAVKLHVVCTLGGQVYEVTTPLEHTQKNGMKPCVGPLWGGWSWTAPRARDGQ